MDSDLFPPLYETVETQGEIPLTPEKRRVAPGDLLDLNMLRPFEVGIKPFAWELDDEKTRNLPDISPPEKSATVTPPSHPAEWDEAEVVFLGTASALPGKYRNVSGIHLSWKNGEEGILMDAGEGTLGQMYRVFGTKFEETILSLRAVFITHMHADHHLGTNRVIQYRHELIQKRGLVDSVEPLQIFAPSIFRGWLEEYGTLVPLSYQFTPIHHTKRIK